MTTNRVLQRYMCTKNLMMYKSIITLYFDLSNLLTKLWPSRIKLFKFTNPLVNLAQTDSSKVSQTTVKKLLELMCQISLCRFLLFSEASYTDTQKTVLVKKKLLLLQEMRSMKIVVHQFLVPITEREAS